jgi:hypothetical protein
LGGLLLAAQCANHWWTVRSVTLLTRVPPTTLGLHTYNAVLTPALHRVVHDLYAVHDSDIMPAQIAWLVPTAYHSWLSLSKRCSISNESLLQLPKKGVHTEGRMPLTTPLPVTSTAV